MMSQLRRFLWCVTFILMVVIPVGGQYMAVHYPSNTQDNGYFDRLIGERSSPPTNKCQQHKLLQLVFTELDVDQEMPNGKFKSLVLETKSKSGIIVLL